MSIPVTGVAYTFFVGLVSQSTRPQLKSAPTIAAGDFKVSTDGGTLNNLATLPDVFPGGSKNIRIQLSASEMNGQNVTVIASDASGSEWDDMLWNITTEPAARVANMTQIDGLATAGNNATLNLKKISIVNTDFGGYGIDVSTTSAGGSGGPVRLIGSGSGNIGINVQAPQGVRIESTAVTTNALELVAATAGYGLGGAIRATVNANLIQIDGFTTNGTNATLNLKQLNINNNTGSAISAVSSGGSGHGILAIGHSSSGAGMFARGGTTTGTYGIGIWADAGANAAPTLTGTGFVCKGGYSGSGMVVDGPNGIVASGSNNGGKNGFVGNLTGDVLGVARANVIQIDGAATNGYNASLYLKGLNIKSDNAYTASVNIEGFDGTVGSTSGGQAISIKGGSGWMGGGSTYGGHGIYMEGGRHGGGGSSGAAIRIDGSGAGGGGHGIHITGSYGSIPVKIAGDQYSNGVEVTGGYGWAGGIQANIKGTLVSLATDAMPEIMTVPADDAPLMDKVAWLFALSKNKITQTGTTQTVRNGSDTATLGASTLSDDSTTSVRGKFA